MKNTLKIKEVDTVVGQVSLIELSSKDSVVTLTSYGAGIFDFKYKGMQLVARPKTLDDYLTSTAYYGKTIGRTSGRLFPPSFQIDGIDYKIKATSNDAAHLHGGNRGFSHKHFMIKAFENHQDYISVTFSYVSKDLEDGYPGVLSVDVMYVLDQNGELTINYEAHTTKDTLCNLTNHIYFNLNENKNNLEDTLIHVDADQYVEIDQQYKPIGLKTLKNSSFNLKGDKLLTDAIKKLETSGFIGFDNAFMLNKHSKDQIHLYQKSSNIGVKIETSYPSVVIYTHNYEESVELENCTTNGVHGSIAIECQYEPSGIYHKDLNSAILRKNERYHHFIKFIPYKK